MLQSHDKVMGLGFTVTVFFNSFCCCCVLCFALFVGKFKDKAETLNNVASCKSESKAKSEGNTLTASASGLGIYCVVLKERSSTMTLFCERSRLSLLMDRPTSGSEWLSVNNIEEINMHQKPAVLNRAI